MKKTKLEITERDSQIFQLPVGGEFWILIFTPEIFKHSPNLKNLICDFTLKINCSNVKQAQVMILRANNLDKLDLPLSSSVKFREYVTTLGLRSIILKCWH